MEVMEGGDGTHPGQQGGGATGAGGGGENPAKKHARVGQWRTPPVPFFPSGGNSSPPGAGGGAHLGTALDVSESEIPIPDSPSGYAMALQEAYRQGAEAASGGGMGINSAVSCPDLGSLQPMLPASESRGTLASVGEEEPDPQLGPPAAYPDHMIHDPSQMGGGGGVGSVGHGGGGGGMDGMDGVPVPAPLPVGPMRIHGAPQSSAQAAPPPGSGGHYGAPRQAGYRGHGAPPQQQHGGGRPPSGGGGGGASRSVSLPDISSYAAQADAEEAKRRKRLARNRASARLRRLRKKNLVESYEGEVGVLESSLAKLRAHSWGVGSDPTALLEALSMDRGQQHVDAEKRRELIRSILAQQREQVQNIRECQLENMVLGWVSRYGADEEGEGEGEGGGKSSDMKTDPDDEEAELAQELQELLALTPEQKEQLSKTTVGLEEERRAIDTVDACLEAMSSNSWLLNAGVEECTDRFMAILNPTQTSKFLLWTDNNSEAIDQLDYVKAPPAKAPPASTPTFYFGMEEGMQHGDDGGEG